MFDDAEKKGDVNLLPDNLRQKISKNKTDDFKSEDLELTDPSQQEVVSLQQGKDGKLRINVQKVSLKPKKKSFFSKLVKFFQSKKKQAEIKKSQPQMPKDQNKIDLNPRKFKSQDSDQLDDARPNKEILSGVQKIDSTKNKNNFIGGEGEIFENKYSGTEARGSLKDEIKGIFNLDKKPELEQKEKFKSSLIEEKQESTVVAQPTINTFQNKKEANPTIKSQIKPELSKVNSVPLPNKLKNETLHDIPGKLTSPDQKDSGLSGGGVDVSLLPQQLHQSSTSPKTSFLLAGAIVLVLGGLIYGFLFINYHQTQNSLNQLEQNIDEVNQQIVNLKKDNQKIVALRKKINLTEYLLDNHIYWQNFFNFLEEYTLDEVFFLGFSCKDREEITLSAQGKDELSAVKQTKLLEKASQVERVNLGDISIRISKEEGKSVQFGLTLKLSPSFFNYQN
ncbi:MAG: hypothetical protein PHS07_03395 [Patescibacteria group bacterium]|nr:hypothetical protein [Patescibacteria group bacterium]